MCLRFRLPYLAPRELLHGLHAATKLSSEFIPGSLSCQRSTSIRWSAVVACAALHQWHIGLSCSNSLRLRLNSAVALALWLSVYVPKFCVLCFGGCVRRCFGMVCF